MNFYGFYGKFGVFELHSSLPLCVKSLVNEMGVDGVDFFPKGGRSESNYSIREFYWIIRVKLKEQVTKIWRACLKWLRLGKL